MDWFCSEFGKTDAICLSAGLITRRPGVLAAPGPAGAAPGAARKTAGGGPENGRHLFVRGPDYPPARAYWRPTAPVAAGTRAADAAGPGGTRRLRNLTQLWQTCLLTQSESK